MEVFKTGTKIKTKVGNYDGYISEILIKDNSVDYKITYQNNGILTIWLKEFEFTTRVTKKQTIGFKT